MAVIVLILSIICYTVKSLLNKLYARAYRGIPGASTPVFALITGVGGAIVTYVYNGFAFSPDRITWIMGLINGAVLFLFNLSVINAST
ncbi:MAG: hypothetical protein J5859_03330, partial [Clostridia bacterium]|nr:hypothetical protein [Clostridia bacterium]